MLTYWALSSFEKINKNTEPPSNAETVVRLDMARNAYASAQIALRCDEVFTLERVTLPTLVSAKLRCERQENIRYDDAGDYPDRLTPDIAVKAEAETIVLWITAYAPSGAEPGTHSGTITIKTSERAIDIPITVQVHKVTLPDAGKAVLSMEYWMNAVGFWWRSPETQREDFIKERFGCERYSHDWWRVVESIADNMRESRCNVLYVRIQDLLADGGSVMDANGVYTFQWGRFDEYIAFFLDRVPIKTLMGFHLIRQAEGGFVHTLLRDTNAISEGDDGGTLRVFDKPVGSEEAENWLNQILPALRTHLVEKGWYSLWAQHIQDEPQDAASWLYGRDFVRRHMPGVRCADALDLQTPAPALQNEMDFWIPRVDIFEKNKEFYDYRLMLGEERWVYTCCLPDTPNYLNKFIDRPLWQNRLLGWACFARGFTGFLHWGYNYWSKTDKMFGLTPEARIKGDGFIVYPDREAGVILNSIRMMATRDAAQDYELLCLAALKDPTRAFALARRMTARFDDVVWDTAEMAENARTLLMLAEGE